MKAAKKTKTKEKKSLKKTKVTEVEISTIKCLLKKHYSISKISGVIKRSKSTVQRYIKKMGLKRESVKLINKKKVGRPSVLPMSNELEEAVKQIISHELANGRLISSSSSLKNLLIQNNLIKSMPRSTFLRYCKRWSLCFSKAQVCPGLTDANIQERIES